MSVTRRQTIHVHKLNFGYVSHQASSELKIPSIQNHKGYL
jgi:hypothetical protein